MNDNIDDCINELKQIFKYETINKKEDYINNWEWKKEEFNNKFNNNALFIISCEFMPNHEEDIKNIHIHSHFNYWGSPDFLNIINKYQLNFNWVDSCQAVIYNDDLKEV
jgi:hypothetical protein